MTYTKILVALEGLFAISEDGKRDKFRAEDKAVILNAIAEAIGAAPGCPLVILPGDTFDIPEGFQVTIQQFPVYQGGQFANCITKPYALLTPLPKCETRFPAHSDRDWTEDFPHENGNYLCKCSVCEWPFFGHKRRVVCRKCKLPAKPDNSAHGYTEGAKMVACGGLIDSYGSCNLCGHTSKSSSAVCTRLTRLEYSEQKELKTAEVKSAERILMTKIAEASGGSFEDIEDEIVKVQNDPAHKIVLEAMEEYANQFKK